MVRSLEEIDAERRIEKQAILAAQAKYRESANERKQAVEAAHYDEAIKQLTIAAEASGRTLDQQAWYWLSEENADDPGHRIQAGLYLRPAKDGS